jgi:hypothetical protein
MVSRSVVISLLVIAVVETGILVLWEILDTSETTVIPDHEVTMDLEDREEIKGILDL